MRQYETFELTYRGPAPTGSHVTVDLAAVFEREGARVEAKGFYAGNGTYKVRFLPDAPGAWVYRVRGIVEDAGALQCEPAAPGRHGLVKAEGMHFVRQDGARYQPFGTTIYALVHQEKALVDRTMRTLAAAPFNKVRMCVFPKDYDYNKNEPQCFAFAKTDGGWDVDRPDPAYWEMLEGRLRELDALGIEADLILFHPYDRWGFAKLTKEQGLRYLDYAVRRLAAFPNVWWSLANEYELVRAFTPDFWTDFATFLGTASPHPHLLSNHQIITAWDFSHPYCTHCCLQSRKIDEATAYAKRYGKPVIYDEMCYEGELVHDWGNLSGAEMTDRFWKVCLQGAFATHGETFLNPEEVVFWSKGGDLVGESPARIGFLRTLLASLPGPLDPQLSQLEEHGDPYAFVQSMKDKVVPGFTDGPFFQMLITFTPKELEGLLGLMKRYAARIGDAAFLQYFGRTTPYVAVFELPEGATYTIEVVDAWNMTRTVVRTDAAGKVEVPLPRREMMAALAVRNA